MVLDRDQEGTEVGRPNVQSHSDISIKETYCQTTVEADCVSIGNEDERAKWPCSEHGTKRIVRYNHQNHHDIVDEKHRHVTTEYDIHRDFSSHSHGGLGMKLRKMVSKVKNNKEKKATCLGFITKLIPIIGVLKTYKMEYLMGDIFSGIAEGVMAIPMGMSYAMLARVPPQYGLYVNLMYPIIYMIFGTSRHASMGVSAIEDLLIGEALTRIINESQRIEDIESRVSYWQSHPERYTAALDTIEANRIRAAGGLCVCMGICFMLMRILKAGIVADLLAVPVLSAFSTASAFLIGTSQLKLCFGFAFPPELENGEFKIIRQWYYCITHIGETNWVSFGLCVSSVVLLALCKALSGRFFKKFPIPGPLIAVILFTAISKYLNLREDHGVRVVGTIPEGFPNAMVPSFSVEYNTFGEGGEEKHVYENVFLSMLKESVVLCAMFFVIHISIAKTITQQKQNYSISPDQELFALGASNFIGSCFQCFPNATSLSRTSVVSSTGGSTQLHHISNTAVLVLTLSLITPLLTELPSPVLASIILIGVYGMVDFREFIRLAKIGGPDALLWVVCFLVTLIFGAMEGVVVSIVLSLLWILWKTARPEVSVLGRLPGTYIYRNVERFPMAKQQKGVLILRFDASLNFANADYFESRVSGLIIPGETQILIVDGSSINDLDITSIRMLERLSKHLKNKEVTLLFANWKGPMRDFLERADFYNTLPPEHCFLCLHDAVVWAGQHVHTVLQDEKSNTMKISVAQRTIEPEKPPFYWQNARPSLSQQISKHSMEYIRKHKRRDSSQDDTQSNQNEYAERYSDAMDDAGTAQDCVSLGGETANRRPSTVLRSKSYSHISEVSIENPGSGYRRHRSHGSHPDENRDETILWDGLSATSPLGMRVVTEITSSGRHIQWAVVQTARAKRNNYNNYLDRLGDTEGYTNNSEEQHMSDPGEVEPSQQPNSTQIRSTQRCNSDTTRGTQGLHGEGEL